MNTCFFAQLGGVRQLCTGGWLAHRRRRVGAGAGAWGSALAANPADRLRPTWRALVRQKESAPCCSIRSQAQLLPYTPSWENPGSSKATPSLVEPGPTSQPLSGVPPSGRCLPYCTKGIQQRSPASALAPSRPAWVHPSPTSITTCSNWFG